ncbi:glycine-rich protein 1-like [Schistocerca cancellata]|uniref:glycine-rich protein 1-like n=1 Tax=Schistocerca cancellata TaxID=274614 RepID=UPI0021174CFF|nr:glycine-rich protein 1-like [Schistocerca cancellata]
MIHILGPIEIAQASTFSQAETAEHKLKKENSGTQGDGGGAGTVSAVGEVSLVAAGGGVVSAITGKGVGSATAGVGDGAVAIGTGSTAGGVASAVAVCAATAGEGDGVTAVGAGSNAGGVTSAVTERGSSDAAVDSTSVSIASLGTSAAFSVTVPDSALVTPRDTFCDDDTDTTGDVVVDTSLPGDPMDSLAACNHCCSISTTQEARVGYFQVKPMDKSNATSQHAVHQHAEKILK